MAGAGFVGEEGTVHVKTGDLVEVIAGDDKGVRGKVLRVDRRSGRVVVEGVNKVYKHVRRGPKNPRGGRLSKEMPVSVSNVMLIDPKTDQPTRVGVRLLPDGTKELYAKRSGARIRILSGPRRRKATTT